MRRDFTGDANIRVTLFASRLNLQEHSRIEGTSYINCFTNYHAFALLQRRESRRSLFKLLLALTDEAIDRAMKAAESVSKICFLYVKIYIDKLDASCCLFRKCLM
jgi:hypothetical protein